MITLRSMGVFSLTSSKTITEFEIFAVSTPPGQNPKNYIQKSLNRRRILIFFMTHANWNICAAHPSAHIAHFNRLHNKFALESRNNYVYYEFECNSNFLHTQNRKKLIKKFLISLKSATRRRQARKNTSCFYLWH